MATSTTDDSFLKLLINFFLFNNSFFTFKNYSVARIRRNLHYTIPRYDALRKYERKN